MFNDHQVSPVKGFESGSDHESEYEILDQSLNLSGHGKLQGSTKSNNNESMVLYNAICDIAHPIINVKGLFFHFAKSI